MNLFKTRRLSFNVTSVLFASCVSASTLLFSQVTSQKNQISDQSDIDLHLFKNSYALIVAIDNYQHMEGLTYPSNDAAALMQALTQNLEFDSKNVRLLKNEEATREAILAALRQFETVGLMDRVLICFAGKTETLDFGIGGALGYTIPYDGIAQSRELLSSTSISTQTWKLLIGKIPAKNVLFVLDGTSGGLPGRAIYAQTKDTIQYIQRLETAHSDEIIAIGGMDEEPRLSTINGCTVFMNELVQGLQTGNADADDDGLVTSGELGVYLRSIVGKTTRQKNIPQYRKVGEGEGEFVFSVPQKKASTASLLLLSATNDVDIYRDSIYLGTASPKLHLRRLELGEYHLRLFKKGYRIKEIPLLITESRRFIISTKLDSTNSLTLVTSVPDAEVYFNGKFRGLTNPGLLLNDLPAGYNRLEIRKKGYLSASSWFMVPQLGDTLYSVVLEPLRRDLAALNVSKPQTAIPVVGESSNEQRPLYPSLIIPGTGQLFNGFYFKGALFNVTFIAAGAGLVYSQLQYSSSLTKYNSAVSAYEKETDPTMFGSRLDKIRTSDKTLTDVTQMRNILAGLTAAIYLLNVADIVIFPPENVSSNVAVQQHGIALNASVTF